MTDAEQMDRAVRRLEAAARRHPRRFKVRVLLLALLGYIYILSVLGALAAVSAAFPATLWLTAPLCVLILLALWIRFPPPKGVELVSADAPRLFRFLEELPQKLYFPHFHSVLLTEEFNAGVTQVPRLGPFGWQKNYLTIGLPLLLGLSPEQFQAILAHEFYHLFGAHSRFDTWLYRLGEAWNRLMDNLEKRRHRGAIFFASFFRWYVPRLNSHTYALSRANEYDADRFAADLIGRRELADALIQLEVKGAFLREVFWPQIHAEERHSPEPPPDLYHRMRRELAAAPDPETAQRWLERAMAIQVGPDESHPSLRERLAAIGAEPRLPPPFAESAADAFLGAALENLLPSLSQRWQHSAAADWRQQHEYLQKARQRLTELSALARQGKLEQEQAAERASLSEELLGPEAALPLYEELLAGWPEHAAANFAVGRLLLARGDAQGAAHVEQSMKLNSDFVLPGCELLYRHFMQCGQGETALVWYARALRHQQEWMLAQRERLNFKGGDKFYTVTLGVDEQNSVAGQLARYGALRAAYLVRKEVKHLADKPCYVLAVQWPWWYPVWDEETLLAKLKNEVCLPVPEAVWAVMRHLPRRVRNRIRSVPGACVFRRRWFRRGWQIPTQG